MTQKPATGAPRPRRPAAVHDPSHRVGAGRGASATMMIWSSPWRSPSGTASGGNRGSPSFAEGESESCARSGARGSDIMLASGTPGVATRPACLVRVVSISRWHRADEARQEIER